MTFSAKPPGQRSAPWGSIRGLIPRVRCADPGAWYANRSEGGFGGPRTEGKKGDKSPPLSVVLRFHYFFPSFEANFDQIGAVVATSPDIS